MSVTIGFCLAQICVTPQSATESRHSWSSYMTIESGSPRKLDDNETNRVRVEFGVPTVIEHNGNRALRITGKAFLKDLTGNGRVAIDWVHPITIGISRRHDAKPDWKNGLKQTGVVVSEYTLINKIGNEGGGGETRRDGSFEALIEVNSIRRVVGESKRFPVAVAFGYRTKDTAYWGSTDAVALNAVEGIEIMGPLPLSPVLRAINEIPTSAGWEFDPASLVRAINQLQVLGQVKAVKSLREFLAIADDKGFGEKGRRHDPNNIDDSNQWCLAIIVPVAFTSETRQPSPKREYITLFADIPFHNCLVNPDAMGPEHTKYLVDWAEKDATVRATRLKPSDMPLDCADEVCAILLSKSKNNISSDNLRRHIRGQAWRMVRHLLVEKTEPEFLDENEWLKVKKKVASLKIRWNEKEQTYIATSQ